MSTDVPGQSAWDEWFDGQYDINLCIDRAVKALSVGKTDTFKVALYSGILEHCAEQMRYALPDMDEPLDQVPDTAVAPTTVTNADGRVQHGARITGFTCCCSDINAAAGIDCQTPDECDVNAVRR